MNDLKRMIFDYINTNNITNEDLQMLLFAIAKETANTNNINRLVWLYMKHDRDNFKMILDDALQQAILFYLEEQETAYKKTMSYIYKQYVSPCLYNAPLENYENELTYEESNHRRCSWNITHYFTKVEQKEYWQQLTLRTEQNYARTKRLFTSTRQKEQTLNKLKKLDMLH